MASIHIVGDPCRFTGTLRCVCVTQLLLQSVKLKPRSSSPVVAAHLVYVVCFGFGGEEKPVRVDDSIRKPLMAGGSTLSSVYSVN